MENNNNKNQVNIELTDEIAEGIYSNLAIIVHSPTEFVVDFIKLMPASPKAKVKSRIILTPQNAKRLYKALAENIKNCCRRNFSACLLFLLLAAGATIISITR